MPLQLGIGIVVWWTVVPLVVVLQRGANRACDERTVDVHLKLEPDLLAVEERRCTYRWGALGAW